VRFPIKKRRVIFLLIPAEWDQFIFVAALLFSPAHMFSLCVFNIKEREDNLMPSP
jgi:hypothetical protein